MNPSKILTDAINLVLRADSKYLTGDYDACQSLLSEARLLINRMGTINSRQVQTLNEEITRIENMPAGRSPFHPSEISEHNTPDLLVMTRALIAAGNLETARKELDRLIRLQPEYCSENPEIILLRKLLSADSDINHSHD